MRIAKIIKNDVVNGIGVCVSLWIQGCPIHCHECQNPEAWDFNGGYEINVDDLIQQLSEAISANGILRGFSILGGEPLAPQNIDYTLEIITKIQNKIPPTLPIFLWTGYEIDTPLIAWNKSIQLTDFNINYLIAGPYIAEQRDITLWLRGSRNQNVYKLTDDKKYVKIDMINGKIQEIE